MKTNVKSRESARVPSAPVRALRLRTGLRHRKSPTRLLKALRTIDERSLPLSYGPEERREIATLVEICAPSQTRDSIKNSLRLLADVEVIFSGWHAPVMDVTFLAAAPKVITQVQYCPRGGFAGRMLNGVFQGANNSNFTGVVTLFTITNTPPEGTLSSQPITNTNAFRYVRYLGPNSGHCNVAEVEFYGYEPLTGFAQWQFQYFDCTNCPEAGPDADPLGKGISNTNQFLLGLNPTNSASLFRIISAVSQGSNVNVTWQTAGGRTNAVQVTSGDTSGGYSNSFVDIPSSRTILPGSGDAVTNYADMGGATNGVSRFYRVRLVP
jgi:hypothetical protein